LSETVTRLDALSPLAVLGRGYALARRESDGRIVRAAGDVSLGDRLELRLASGQIGAEVTRVEPDDVAG
jgi:exodeoxyribonuclease VII large subunit